MKAADIPPNMELRMRSVNRCREFRSSPLMMPYIKKTTNVAAKPAPTQNCAGSCICCSIIH
jgi:hypothetical protein